MNTPSSHKVMGFSALTGESHSQMEGVQAEDRHDPLPHITLLTTALKSIYENTAVLSIRTTVDLRKLLIPDGRE